MVLGARSVNINDKQTLQDIIAPGQFLGLFLRIVKWIKTQMCGWFGVSEIPDGSHVQLHQSFYQSLL